MSTFSIDPRREQIKALATLDISGPIYMLNLIRFKDKVEGTNVSGAEQYHEYGKEAAPFLVKAGGKVIWQGEALLGVIAPEEAGEWDEILIVEYPSKEHFLTMIQNPDYPSALRTKAVLDSRLILSQVPKK